MTVTPEGEPLTNPRLTETEIRVRRTARERRRFNRDTKEES